MRFSVRLPDEILDSLGAENDVRETIEAAVSGSRERGWNVTTDRQMTEAQTKPPIKCAEIRVGIKAHFF